MALFAKRLECWASEISYSAILAIAKKKGGNPISHIVYACESKGEDGHFVMRSFFSFEEARKHVASGLRDGFIVTSPWLNHVATGFYGDGWMRVPTPRIGPRKRGRRPPLFGDLGFLYRTAKAEEVEANERMKTIEHELDELVEEYGPKKARKSSYFKQLEDEKNLQLRPGTVHMIDVQVFTVKWSLLVQRKRAFQFLGILGRRCCSRKHNLEIEHLLAKPRTSRGFFFMTKPASCGSPEHFEYKMF